MASFGIVKAERGSQFSEPFKFVWDDDGSDRNVSGQTVKFTVYSDQGITILFGPITGTPGPDTSQQMIPFTVANNTNPVGSYYAKLELLPGNGDDLIWHGTYLIEGA